MMTRIFAVLLMVMAQQSSQTKPHHDSMVQPSQAVAGSSASDNMKPTLAAQIELGPNSHAAEAAEQIGEAKHGHSSVPQVTQAKDGREITPQLAPNTPSAAPPPPLSQPGQGRDTRAVALKGKDLCSDEKTAKETEVCARVIETRSAEFPVPDHEPLSPEERLLADQTMLEGQTTDINMAARRLSNGRNDDTLADLAVASLTLSRPVVVETQKQEEAKAPAPSVLDALVDAIVRQANGGAPPN